MRFSLKGLFSGITVAAVGMAVVQFLAAHLNAGALSPTLQIIIAAILAGLGIGTHHGVSVSAQTPSGPSKLGLLLLLGLLPMNLQAQHRKALAADTVKAVHVELGADAVMRTDSVTEPQSVRIGLLLGSAFTVEYRASATRSEGYFEATADLGITAALLSGSTNRAGQYVEPLLSYHYDGGPAQLGVGVEVGTRTATIGPMAIRASMFTIDYFATKRLPTVTSVGARVGVSFWR